MRILPALLVALLLFSPLALAAPALLLPHVGPDAPTPPSPVATV